MTFSLGPQMGIYSHGWLAARYHLAMVGPIWDLSSFSEQLWLYETLTAWSGDKFDTVQTILYLSLGMSRIYVSGLYVMVLSLLLFYGLFQHSQQWLHRSHNPFFNLEHWRSCSRRRLGPGFDCSVGM